MSQQDFQYKQLFAAFETLDIEHVDVSVIASTSSMLYLVKRTQAVGIVSEDGHDHPPEGTVVVPIFDQEAQLALLSALSGAFEQFPFSHEAGAKHPALIPKRRRRKRAA